MSSRCLPTFTPPLEYEPSRASPRSLPVTTRTQAYEVRRRTLIHMGVYHFLPMDLVLPCDPTRHRGKHVGYDLEAFYWVLLWLVMRRVEHNLGQDGVSELFFYMPHSIEVLTRKMRWVRGVPSGPESGERTLKELVFADDLPLTWLMEEFRTLVRKQDTEGPALTYDATHEMLDKAIDMHKHFAKAEGEDANELRGGQEEEQEGLLAPFHSLHIDSPATFDIPRGPLKIITTPIQAGATVKA